MYCVVMIDPVPPPWDSNGKEFDVIVSMNHTFINIPLIHHITTIQLYCMYIIFTVILQYPAGYLEAHEDTATTSNKGKSKGALRVKTSKKRPVTDDESPVETKKCRLEKFTPPKQVTDLIAKDTQNEKLWTECSQQETKQAYLAKVQEQFFCICCQEVVFKPVTTPCKHNLCLVSVSVYCP